MVTEERMKNLEAYVEDWKKEVERARLHLDYLFRLHQMAVKVNDQKGADVLQTRINATDAAANENNRCLTFAQSLLGRAQNGEDV